MYVNVSRTSNLKVALTSAPFGSRIYKVTPIRLEDYLEELYTTPHVLVLAIETCVDYKIPKYLLNKYPNIVLTYESSNVNLHSDIKHAIVTKSENVLFINYYSTDTLKGMYSRSVGLAASIIVDINRTSNTTLKCRETGRLGTPLEI